MRIRLIIRLGRRRANVTEQAPVEIFRAAVENRKRLWLPMLGSLAAHVALVFLVSAATRQLTTYYADEIDWSSYRAEPLRVRVPKLHYYAAQTKPGQQKEPDPSAASGSSADLNRGRSLRQSHRPAIANDLELPHLERSDTATTTILQPDTPPEKAAVDPKIPSLAFWARRNSVPPKRLRDQITTPGLAEPPGPPPRLASQPVLAISNLEPEMGERNIAAASDRSSTSRLPPASATSPIRDLHSEPLAGTFDSLAGEAANLIAFSAAPTWPGEVVSVPPTSHSAVVPQGDGSGQAGGNRLGPPAVNSAPKTGSSSAADTSGTQERSVGSTATARFEVSETGIAIKTLSANAQTPRVDASGAEAFIRIMHPPAGNFDVVVTKPGGRNELNGSGSTLKGSPVYTVYLRVGDESEWTLEFCPMSIPQPQNNSYQVYVEDPTPLSAPYPITTIIPKSVLRETRSATVIFHGFLTAAGRFRDMEPDQSGATAESVASVLQDWQFRPARRHEVPIEVEVLLIVARTSR
jgi:hypothetical protein